MSCSKPISIGKNKINAPCGRCINCLQKKRSDWTIRALEEYKNSSSAFFVTLTYSEKYLPYVRIFDDEKSNKKTINLRKSDPIRQYLNEKSWTMDQKEIEKIIAELNGIDPNEIRKTRIMLKRIPTLKKSDLQNYFKRLRTINEKIKYFAVGEYGSKGSRPHYHAIIYNAKDITLLDKWTVLDKETGEMEPIGNVKIGDVSQASIHYITKYLINDESRDRRTQQPFQVSSKGFGINYTTDNGNYHRNSLSMEYIAKNGTKLYLPRYYKEKIFIEEKDKEAIKLKYSYIASLNEQEKLNETPELRAELRKKAKFLARKSSKSKSC